MNGRRRIAAAALPVRDHDEAIAWFRGALGFALLEDSALEDGKRRVRTAPAGDAGFCLLLAKATTRAQQAAVGNQHGGRVGFFLHSDDSARDHARLVAAGARFEEAPWREPYGTVAVFGDLYGNRRDLIGPAADAGA